MGQLTQMVNGDQSHFTKEYIQSEALAKGVVPRLDPTGPPSSALAAAPAPVPAAAPAAAAAARGRKTKDSSDTVAHKAWFTKGLRGLIAAGMDFDRLGEKFKVTPSTVEGWLSTEEKKTTFPNVEARLRMVYHEAKMELPVVDSSYHPDFGPDLCKELRAWRLSMNLSPEQAGAVLKMGASTWSVFEGSEKSHEDLARGAKPKVKMGTKNKLIAAVLINMMRGKTKWEFPPHKGGRKTTKANQQPKAAPNVLAPAPMPIAAPVPATVPTPAPAPTPIHEPVVSAAPAAPAPPSGRLSARVKEAARKMLDVGGIASLDQLREATTLLAEILD